MRTGKSDHRFVGSLFVVWLGTALPNAVAVSTVAAATSPSRPDDPKTPCPLCTPELEVPVVQLTAARLESLAADHAARNEREIARIDSLLRSGLWGPPESKEARRRAHLLARISLINAYHDLVRWAGASDRVYEASGEALAGIYRRYTDVNLFVGPRLVALRIGRGRACARYAVEEPGEGESMHGGRRVRWEVREAKIEGERRRVLDVKMPTGQDGEVRFLFAAHHTMKVSHERIDEPPVAVEWFLVHDIEGAWVKKWGTHRPTAYMSWASCPSSDCIRRFPARSAPVTLAGFVPPAGGAPPMPETPLVGVRVYVPGLRLRLPVLPDIDIDDLREADVIMPVLDLDYLREGRQPSWLVPDETSSFVDWKGNGSVPDAIRERFPDF